jgi:mono/diheme cytochrome c family protein
VRVKYRPSAARQGPSSITPAAAAISRQAHSTTSCQRSENSRSGRKWRCIHAGVAATAQISAATPARVESPSAAIPRMRDATLAGASWAAMPGGGASGRRSVRSTGVASFSPAGAVRRPRPWMPPRAAAVQRGGEPRSGRAVFTGMRQPHPRRAGAAHALAAATALAMLTTPVAAQSPSAPGAADPVATGRYLAILGGCSDCHTAQAGAYAGGRVLTSGIGSVASANITPDPDTGIGTWSADDFYRAMHEGRSRKAGHLYPAFPYPHFTKITRADSDALYAFLRSQPPVRNDPKRNQLPFPLSIRGFMAVWNGLFFHKGTFQPDPAQSAQLNTGAYIVQALAHCGACHSPKNSLQAEVASREFQGGTVEGWWAPNLTPEPRTGLGGWSQQDLVDFLKTGRNRRTAAGGPMAGVVAGSTSHMDDNDLGAISAYLLSRPASPPPAAPRVDDAAVARGQAVFAANCAGCHGAEGKGGTGRFAPALDSSALAQATDPATILRYLLDGARTPVTEAQPTPAQMPGFAAKLDDRALADVASYIRAAWSNRASSVSPREVAKLRAKSAGEHGPS